MIYRFALEDGTSFSLRPILEKEVDEVFYLCGECVGENLYSRKEIAAARNAADRFFYILKNEKDETVGYIYYYLTDEAHIAKCIRLDAGILRSLYNPENKKIGVIQSVGLREAFRGIGIADHLMQFALREFRALSADAVFIVCWKPGGVVPLKRALKNCDFKFGVEAKKIWYDDVDLICPSCHGRCTCDAEVYYKTLDGGMQNETETFA